MGTELRQDCYCVLLLLGVSSHVVVILTLNCDYNEDTTLDCSELGSVMLCYIMYIIMSEDVTIMFIFSIMSLRRGLLMRE